MSAQAHICPSCGYTNEVYFPHCPQCRFPNMLVAGKYRLNKLLKEGGVGQVYLAYHTRLSFKRDRVIKVIKSEIFQQEGIQTRFEREVEITSALSQSNDHIVRIYDDFGHEPGLGYYYVMEHLQGQTLRDILPDGTRLSDKLSLHIFYQMCRAMVSAHNNGIVHRDLKPENIFLVERDGESCFVKIIDFGLARPEGPRSRVTGAILGTPEYMAPEQCKSDPVDARTDLYSMAILLYEMLSAHHPYDTPNRATKNQGGLAIMLSHLQMPATPLSMYRPDLKGFSNVIEKALSKDPDARQNSIETFWQELTDNAPLGLSLPAIENQGSPMLQDEKTPSTLMVHSSSSPSIPSIDLDIDFDFGEEEEEESRLSDPTYENNVSTTFGNGPYVNVLQKNQGSASSIDLYSHEPNLSQDNATTIPGESLYLAEALQAKADELRHGLEADLALEPSISSLSSIKELTLPQENSLHTPMTSAVIKNAATHYESDAPIDHFFTAPHPPSGSQTSLPASPLNPPVPPFSMLTPTPPLPNATSNQQPPKPGPSFGGLQLPKNPTPARSHRPQSPHLLMPSNTLQVPPNPGPMAPHPQVKLAKDALAEKLVNELTHNAQTQVGRKRNAKANPNPNSTSSHSARIDEETLMDRERQQEKNFDPSKPPPIFESITFSLPKKQQTGVSPYNINELSSDQTVSDDGLLARIPGSFQNEPPVVVGTLLSRSEEPALATPQSQHHIPTRTISQSRLPATSPHPLTPPHRTPTASAHHTSAPNQEPKTIRTPSFLKEDTPADAMDDLFPQGPLKRAFDWAAENPLLTLLAFSLFTLLLVFLMLTLRTAPPPIPSPTSQQQQTAPPILPALPTQQQNHRPTHRTT